VLEPFLRDRIPLQHDAVPRTDRKDIRGHRVELLVWDLDEIEPDFFKGHAKARRQKPRIRDSEILVDEADQRHQMEAGLRSLVVRERDGLHANPRSLEKRTKLLFDETTHRCIGGGIVGTHAGDLIGEICLAVEMGCDPVDIGKTIHPHPTLGESIGMAAEVFEGVCTDLPPVKKK